MEQIEFARDAPAEITLSHFFDAKQREPLQQSCSGMVQGLLSQLLLKMHEKAQWPDDFLTRLDRMLPDNASGPASTFEQRLYDAVDNLPLSEVCIWIIIDALDESGEDAKEVARVLQTLVKRAEARPNVRAVQVIASIQLGSPCKNFFPRTGKEIFIGENNNRDIRTFVEERLKPEMEDDLDLQPIATSLVQRSQNTFLWVHLVIEELLINIRDLTESEIQDVINTFPSSLNGVYSKLLSIITRNDQLPGAAFIFQFMLFAQRPPRVTEMGRALWAWQYIKEPDLQKFEKAFGPLRITQRVQNTCRGLIELRPGSNQEYTFIHDSFRLWLLGETGDSDTTGMASLDSDLLEELEPKSHLKLLQTCLMILARGTFENKEAKDPCRYALTYWLKHANICSRSFSTEEIRKLAHADLLLTCRTPQSASILDAFKEQVTNHGSEEFSNASTVSSIPAILAGSGNGDLLKLHLEQCDCLKIDDTLNQIMYNCVYSNHVDILQMLCAEAEAKAKQATSGVSSAAAEEEGQVPMPVSSHLNAPLRLLRGETLLYRASYKGFTQVVQVLLDLGASPSLRVPTRQPYTYPLHAAAALGHLATVKAILQHPTVVPHKMEELHRKHITRVGTPLTAQEMAAAYVTKRRDKAKWVNVVDYLKKEMEVEDTIVLPSR